MPSLAEWLRFPERLFFWRTDERIYAAVRMGFAAVALLNLLLLWPDRHIFFSDAGILDAEAARAAGSPAYFSIFAFARSEEAVTWYMMATAFALVMLFFGIAARFFALWALVWQLSYIARAPLACTGWDFVLQGFSLLILVSPLGKCWTLPALLRGAGKAGPALVSAHGLVLMRLQVVVIYWQAVFTRIAKDDPNFWNSGEFMSYFLLSHHARWPGPWVLELGPLLALATHATQLVEVTIPVLLWVRKTRRWGALLGFCLHAGISLLTRSIEVFSLSMLMTYLAFLRAEDINELRDRLKRVRQ
jgi:hypothetical protein